jgi:hypothetical protein
MLKLSIDLLAANCSILLVQDFKDNEMCRGDISGSEKAKMIKKMLGISEEQLLMQEFGRRREILLCRETEFEWEIVIPISLVTELTSAHAQTIISSYKADGGCLSHRKSEFDGENTWKLFDDLDLRNMKNQPPAWISERIS